MIEYGKMLYNQKNEFNNFMSYLLKNGHSKKNIDNYALKIKNDLQTKEIPINRIPINKNQITINNNNSQNDDILDDILGLFRKILFSSYILCI